MYTKEKFKMNERIEKKLQQIAKIEKKIAKWESAKTPEKFWKEEECWFTYWARQHKEYDGSVKTKEDFFNEKYNGYLANCDDEIRRAKKDLEIANVQLEKIKKQEEIKNAKESTLQDMPEAIKEFAIKMENIWNEYDKNEKARLRDEYERLNSLYPKNSIQGYKDFIKMYKYQGYEKMYTSDEDIEKANKKAVDQLILNLFERVIDKTGKITDASCLTVSNGNSGYAVINGVVYGEKGNAIVESIGAGGYNIQRYHIRTLVK